MLTILSSNTVTPYEPTPNVKFSLSDCDQIKLPTHAPMLYVYKPNKKFSVGNPIETLTNSLSQALVHYYPIAGRLCLIEGGRFEVHCNSMGVQLLEAFCEADLDEFDDFEPTKRIQHLFLKINYDCPIQEIPLMVVQLTSFLCGSHTLGVAISRAVVDGSSAMRFVNSWAKLAKGEKLDSSIIPVYDRALLKSSKQHTTPRFDHVEFNPPPSWISCSETETKTEQTSVAVLKISKNQIEKLKKEANGVLGNKNSTFEVISGHLWRSVCKARYVGCNNGYQPTRLTTLVNCRKRMKPPIPDVYFGNAVFPTVTPTCQFKDIVEKPLSYTVSKISEAIGKVTEEYVRSALDYIANQKDMNFLRTSFHSSAENPNLFVVSWMNFPNNDTDFGWGNPIYMGPGNINSEGKVFVMKNGVEDGSLIIAICLKATHINAFKKFFYEDIKEVFPAAKL
ncbi:spermidine hydroxycinnamoyl transferase-like [Quillaja saponaria]|uniref:Spermidine hydroxycinnamoyl transferase-like n=1 Tax=Quillaja saponaria TaxID=32244 RepID=A0AAD7PZC3_QUISA|nr:spermidine hydroxycinnamoyl transferase-like [Quillaja saponaria]